MAAAVVVSENVKQRDGNLSVDVWDGLAWDAEADEGEEGSVGKGLRLPSFPDKTVVIRGTFGTGGTLIMEGSNNSTDGLDGNWIQLADVQGNALSKTASAIEVIQENPLWIRPRVTAGDADTDIAVEMCSVKHYK